jgi:hypothetical protein
MIIRDRRVFQCRNSIEIPTCEVPSLQGELGKSYRKVEDYYTWKSSGDALNATRFQVLLDTVNLMSQFVFEKDEYRIHENVCVNFNVSYCKA